MASATTWRRHAPRSRKGYRHGRYPGGRRAQWAFDMNPVVFAIVPTELQKRGTLEEPESNPQVGLLGLEGMPECPRMLVRPARSSENVLTLRGKRILVVEDDPVIAIDYHFQLEGIGAIHAFAPNNQRALAYLIANRVDAAIIDYHLPDGCCMPILEMLVSQNVPFVVVSGDTFAIPDASIDAPVLSKPATPAEVCQALSGVLH
jgi:CheY-like chemotaxis protein